MSQRSISRRQFLLIASGTVIVSSQLSGCQVVGRTVVVNVLPRLGKIFSVLLDIAESAMTIAALVDAAQKTFGVKVPREDVIRLTEGARLIIVDGSGRQFQVRCELLNGSSSSQNNPSPSSTDEHQRPARLQNVNGDMQRIHFSRGATSTSVYGSIESNGLKRYLLGARAGQTMTVSLASRSAKFDVYFQKRGNLLGEATTSWQGTLPNSGDYIVSVYSYEKDTYKLYVSIV